MICQFSFQNFRSYKKETVLDFQAAALPEFKNTLITEDNASDVLPVSVVYGPNGGGKSNLLLALSCLITTIVRPVHELQKNRQSIIIQQSTDAMPFLFDSESNSQPTEFSIFFRVDIYEYCYYISLNKSEIFAESLFKKSIKGKKSAMLFERDKNHIELGYSINRKSINKSVNPKMPYLSFLAINYEIPVINEVISWFEGCIIRSYSNPSAEKLKGIDAIAEKEEFIKALNDIDIDIIDYRYDAKLDELFMKRKIGNTEYELPFSEESDGTKKLIAALPLILLALKEGRLVIIDELDAKLHPKLLRYIILLFKNKKINRKGAQLLFTSHDMYTLRNTVFRRDEIWFAAENSSHESEIYSLHEIRGEDNERIKNTAAYDKQYLEGRYGADPYLSSMLEEFLNES